MMYTRKYKNAFSIIEAVVLIAVFSIATLGFYKTYTLAAIQMIEAKKRLSAIALASERMEQIRNVPYDDIGTTTGSPSGTLLADEVVIVNSIEYRIMLDVRYIDDPNDGTISTTDTLPDDYRRVQVFVAWGEATDSGVTEAEAKGTTHRSQRVDITSQFVAPGGLESATGNGILSVNVLESDATPVPGASVQIVHTGSPVVSYTGLTDASGNLSYSTPPGTSYEVTISKAGYETIYTENPYDGVTQLYDPTNQHQTVLISQLTTATLITNLVSDFDVLAGDPFCGTFSPGVEFDFDIVGGRIKGTDPTDGGAPVYVLDTSLTTDTVGAREIYTDTDGDGTVETTGDDEASSGSYVITLNEPGYVFWKLFPAEENNAQMIDAQGGTVNCNMIIARESDDAALITVVDTSGAEPVLIEGATVRLQNIGIGYVATQTSDVYGKVYFPENATEPLVNGTEYELRVTAEGYDEQTTTLTITNLEQPSISLTPSS